MVRSLISTVSKIGGSLLIERELVKNVGLEKAKKERKEKKKRNGNNIVGRC